MRDRSLPLSVLPPDGIGLITSSNLAVITWKPPPLLPFQGIQHCLLLEHSTGSLLGFLSKRI